MLIVALTCNPTAALVLMYIDELQFICNKKRQILRKFKQAPTKLVASMCKLNTLKHNLRHFVTLMKDTVSNISISRKNDIMAKTNQMGM